MQRFDNRMFGEYNLNNMKKLFLGFLLICTMTVAACGVKSNLDNPDPSYPRNYPVY